MEGMKGFLLRSLTCLPVPKPTWVGFFSSAMHFNVTIFPSPVHKFAILFLNEQGFSRILGTER
jgi:hypothetical protein